MANDVPGTGSPINRRHFLVLGGAGIVAAAAVATGCSSGSGSSTVKVKEPKQIAPPKLDASYQPPPSSTLFDTAITGGRVMDPATG